ncbi:MAG: barstar family protein [Clostridia bacterium]|nr:barstar family protein [Clostridia bacterium]MBP5207354.1 barstar family protein [Clostridia bacterium]
MFTKKIEVDASLFTDRKAVHDALRAAIGSEDYIGSNLDALNDVLTSIGRKTRIKIRHFCAARDNLGEYAETLAYVLASAACSNPYLTVIFE